MISEQSVRRFCKDDITKIENYELAMADLEHTWCCHHRLEVTISGEYAHTVEDLKRMDMYYHRPYYELIFLTREEHMSIHMKGKPLSDETKKKISEAQKGKKRAPFSDEYRSKMSKVMTGRKLTDEHKSNLSKSLKGRHFTDDWKSNLSKSLKGRTLSEETRHRMSISRKGHTVSEETRHKISATKKLRLRSLLNNNR